MSKVEGLDRLKRRLAAMPVEARKDIRKALDEGAARIVNLSRGLAPVDEGDLRRSIRVLPGEHELQVKVAAGGPLTQRPVRHGLTAPRFDYAGKAEAQNPFFFPAYRALKKSISSKVGKATRDAAKRAAGGGQ